MAYAVDMVYTDSMVSHCWHVGMGAEGAERAEGAEGAGGAEDEEGEEGAGESEGGEVVEEADGTDVDLHIYCRMVRTPWEKAIWRYGASEQKIE